MVAAILSASLQAGMTTATTRPRNIASQHWRAAPAGQLERGVRRALAAGRAAGGPSDRSSPPSTIPAGRRRAPVSRRRASASPSSSSAVQPIGDRVRRVVGDVKADVVLGDPAGDLRVGRAGVEDRPSDRQRREELRRDDDACPVGAQADEMQIRGREAARATSPRRRTARARRSCRPALISRASSSARLPRTEKQIEIAFPVRARQARARRSKAENSWARPIVPE